MRNITFINAGAGSGKTYSLTRQLVKDIQDGHCHADQVILTTFTKLAANEFISETRKALLKAGETEQANLLASAAMGTVHSVAYQLIERYWYLLGSGVELDIMAEEDVEFYINQSLANVPTEEELDKLASLTRELGFKRDYNMPDESRWKMDLTKVINLALTNRITNLEHSKIESLREVDELYRPVDVEIDESALRQSLEVALEESRNFKPSDSNDKRIRQLREFLGRSQYTVSDLLDIRGFLTRRNNLPQAILNIDTVQQAIGALSMVHRSEILAKRIRAYISIIFDLADGSIHEFREYKQQNNIVDYTDMEVHFLELLEKEEIRGELSSRFKMVFVDEFQDSSPIQLQIFMKLSEIVKHSYWVGDPKQAIYAFRGTDPSLIQALVKEISLDCQRENRKHLNLDNLPDSWRSRPGIVNLCNEIFTTALAEQVVQPQHIRLNPVRDDEGFDKENHHPATQHWHIDDGFRTKKERYHHHLASMVHDLIHSGVVHVMDKAKSRITRDKKGTHHLMMKQLVPGDIGILCRKHDNIHTLAESLNRFGIETAAEKAGLIDTAEIQLLIALMNYMLDDADSLARATILLLGGSDPSSGKLLDDRLEFLYGEGAMRKPVKDDYIGREEEYDKEFQTYRNWLKTWGAEDRLLEGAAEIRSRIMHLSVPAIVDKIIHELAITDVAKRWGRPLQRSGNLQTAMKLAKQYNDRCLIMNLPASLQGFIEYLRQFEGSDLKQSAATGDNAVNILTYHGAKGLEWPVVILTDLESNHTEEGFLIRNSFFGCSLDSPDEVNLEDPFEGKKIILQPWPFGAQKNVGDDLRNEIRGIPRFTRTIRKEDEETRRLLYVGMTRARDILVTTSFKKEQPAWLNTILGHQDLPQVIGKVESGQQSDLFKVGEKITLFKYDFQNDDQYPETEKGIVKSYMKQGTKSQDDPKYLSPSNATADPNAKASIIRDIHFRIEINGSLADREDELGTCLHDIFYMYDQEHDIVSFTPVMDSILENHKLKSFIPNTECIYRSISGLYNLLEEQYGSARSIYKELPLQLVRDGCIIRGEADLVWETEGEMILVDYKSYPGKISHITDPEHKRFSGRYSGQLNAYREMIDIGHPKGKKVSKMLIWYGILGALVEINI